MDNGQFRCRLSIPSPEGKVPPEEADEEYGQKGWDYLTVADFFHFAVPHPSFCFAKIHPPPGGG